MVEKDVEKLAKEWVEREYPKHSYTLNSIKYDHENRCIDVYITLQVPIQFITVEINIKGNDDEGR